MSNAKGIGEAPVQAMTSLDKSLAHSVGTLFENAVGAASAATGNPANARRGGSRSSDLRCIGQAHCGRDFSPDAFQGRVIGRPC
ncbi:hypothetical protein DYQ91_06970 [Xanthomonas sp. LMG 8989]|nr:hypothetical protein [Xanthomonas sp. LMG 8989]